VATDVGSCREIIEGADASEEPGGYVVRACDPPATAAALADILLQPGLRVRMGRAMRERVHRIYNQPRITRMYNELYDSLGSPEETDGLPEARGAAPWPA
jgi:glycosyltransferase involved in cell wall biosynthesis